MRRWTIAATIAGIALAGCAHAQQAPAPAATAASDAEAAHRAQTEATRAVAMAFLNRYFIEHNFGAYAEFAHPDFIQHNPKIANGVAGHRAYFAKIFGAPKPDPAPPPPRHVTDMVLVDGDLFSVMHHSVDSTGAARLFVDIWRVADGKIAEHWDVIQDIPATSAHGNGMACGNYETWERAQAWADSIVNPTCGRPDPASKRADSLKTFQDYVAQVGAGDVFGAIERYLSAGYRQHSPVIGDGKQGAIDYLRREWGDLSGPKPSLGPQRIVAEGDYVLVHYILTDGATGKQSAQVDVFRIRGGQISEHWDLKQPVPEKTESGNPMW
ncbi:nuclear transport factor 2 family protein [Sphingomonas canadensis]|uniref:Nuclear transport factor 2 family protein n=1 Tax=Sphingomonas canadensis TaxID=1219257 RepID=A0ABW3HAT3_9SPHN|nr:nuclear transport factor 2 family protein [Sphingomonas canadensis]MCW3838301.1 nuclear transport factor 2 family protein [Sphingomonas canadensis]